MSPDRREAFITTTPAACIEAPLGNFPRHSRFVSGYYNDERMRERLYIREATLIGGVMWSGDADSVVALAAKSGVLGRDLKAGTNLAGQDVGVLEMALLRRADPELVRDLALTLALDGDALTSIVARVAAPFKQGQAEGIEAAANGFRWLLSKEAGPLWAQMACLGTRLDPAQWSCGDEDLLTNLCRHAQDSHLFDDPRTHAYANFFAGVRHLVAQGFLRNDAPQRVNALWITAHNADPQLLALLLEAGADPFLPNAAGDTPADILDMPMATSTAGAARHDLCTTVWRSFRAGEMARQAIEACGHCESPPWSP